MTHYTTPPLGTETIDVGLVAHDPHREERLKSANHSMAYSEAVCPAQIIEHPPALTSHTPFSRVSPGRSSG